MRKIHSLIKNKDGSWRIRSNEEIDLLSKDAHIVRYIRAQRIRLIGHSVSICVERMVK